MSTTTNQARHTCPACACSFTSTPAKVKLAVINVNTMRVRRLPDEDASLRAIVEQRWLAMFANIVDSSKTQVCFNADWASRSHDTDVGSQHMQANPHSQEW